MKISIITVVYNSVNTIEQTIHSVINQCCTDIEYIIIDGGSNDGTLDIIRKYENRLSFWCSEHDSGIYNAMNKGLTHASGDVIGIINSDDWYGEDALKIVKKCFEDKDIDVLYGDLLTHSNDGQIGVFDRSSLTSVWRQMPFGHPTVFIKKAAYSNWGNFNEKYRIVADYELILRFYLKKAKFGYVNRYLANFREGGISSKNSSLLVKEMDEVIFTFIDSELFKQAIDSFIDSEKDIIVYGYGKIGKFFERVLRKASMLEERNVIFFDSNDELVNNYSGDINLRYKEQLASIYENQLIIVAIYDSSMIVDEIQRNCKGCNVVVFNKIYDEYEKLLADRIKVHEANIVY